MKILQHENFQIDSFHVKAMLLADHNMTTEVPTGDGLHGFRDFLTRGAVFISDPQL